MATRKRTPKQIEADAEVIATLTRRGYGLKQIAAEIGKIRNYSLSYAQVSHDLKKIRADWAESARSSIEAIKHQELEGLADQERECWHAWQKSKTEHVKKRTKTKPGTLTGTRSVENTTEKEEQCGDPAYMRLILDIREKRAKILGLNAPEKAELSGPDGGPIRVENEYDDEHLTQWAADRFRPREVAAAGSEASEDGSV